MEVELSTLQPRSQHQGEASTATATPKATSRKSLEMIETGAVEVPQSSDAPETAVSASTPETRRKARIQYAACCYVLFLAGWNDGTTGPLLPRLQQVYQVRSDDSCNLRSVCSLHTLGQLCSGLAHLRFELHRAFLVSPSVNSIEG